MRIIKLLLISFIVIAGIILAISSLLPRHVRISRAVDVSSTPEAILKFTADLTEWKKWNTFVADSMLTGPVRSKDRIHAGNMEIHLVSASKDSIVTEWNKGGRPIQCVFRIIPSKEVVIVQWYFDFDLKWYPWEKFASIIFDKQLGPYMETSLASLKNLAENL